jgi:hypothetical protein
LIIKIFPDDHPTAGDSVPTRQWGGGAGARETLQVMLFVLKPVRNRVYRLYMGHILYHQ